MSLITSLQVRLNILCMAFKHFIDAPIGKEKGKSYTVLYQGNEKLDNIIILKITVNTNVMPKFGT